MAGPFPSAKEYLAGWPWWWLLLPLLLLLLLILLCCCLLWCLSGRYRSRKDRRRIVVNGQTPLLGHDKDKMEMAGNLQALESRIDNIRGQLDSRHGGSREGDIDSDYGLDRGERGAVGRRRRRQNLLQYNQHDQQGQLQHQQLQLQRDQLQQSAVIDSTVNVTREQLLNILLIGQRGKGDFEDGYVRGFRDASKVGSASAAKRRMEDDYGARDDRFHSGYVQGLRDAGLTGMSTSMHNLAVRGQPKAGEYSAGYTQGFRDGDSGIFGDRITTTLLRRLEEQYPDKDEFRQGYVDGFKDGAAGRAGKKENGETARILQKSLSELTDRLHCLEKKGDEIHSTKIYHVYNQQPEVVGYNSSGQQLAHEMEEVSSSRRSTLRRHYTPGDYLKYGSDLEGYGSLRQNRRSLSASALGRDELYQSSSAGGRNRYVSGIGTTGPGGPGSSYISRSGGERQQDDSYGRRYNYRSRSDIIGDISGQRRYASQTLLDGSRPGPTSSPHWRRDALQTLQRELDTLSRSPVPDSGAAKMTTSLVRGGGYSSDTGHYANDTVRSRQQQQMTDYDSYQMSRSKTTTSGAVGSSVTGRSQVSPRYPLVPPPPPRSATSVKTTGSISSPDATSSPTGMHPSSRMQPMTSSPAQAAQSGLSQAYHHAAQSSSSAVTGRGPPNQRGDRFNHNWPDDLMDIVQEPMGHTLDRMKLFTASPPASRIRDQPYFFDGGVKESVEESYQASYKEEFAGGPSSSTVAPPSSNQTQKL